MFKTKIINFIQVWIESIKWIYLKYLSKFPSRTIRLYFLRRYGANIADKVSIFADVEYRCPSKLIIKSGCSIGPRVLLDARSGLEIGMNTTIAAEAMIWSLHHDYNDINFKTIGGKVVIGDYAWICSRAIILPGVIIGKGAVVASGAVVTSNVEPYTIVGGIPAKKIGDRKRQEYSYVPYYKLHMV